MGQLGNGKCRLGFIDTAETFTYKFFIAVHSFRIHPFYRSVVIQNPTVFYFGSGFQFPLIEPFRREMHDLIIHSVLNLQQGKQFPVCSAQFPASKSDPIPPRAASTHFMVGGSWQWSPARIIRSALRMAIQQAGSNACAASSINKVPNLRPVRTRLAELTNVQAMTRASLNKASLMRISSSVAPVLQ